MTQLELHTLLQETYQSSFLDSILLLTKQEQNYKKSEFYKATRVPLLELYKTYYQYMKSEYGIEEKIKDIIENFDVKLLQNKIEDLVQNLEKSPKFKDFLNTIVEKFNLQDLMDQSEELKESLSSIQK